MKCHICHHYDFLMWKEVASPCIEIPKFGHGYAGYLKSVVCSYVSMHHSIHSQKPHLFLGPFWRQHLPKLHFLYLFVFMAPHWAYLQVEWLSILQRHTLPLAALNALAARQSQGRPATHLTASSMFGMSPQEGFMSGIWRSGFRILFIPQHGERNHLMNCFLTPNLESLKLSQNMGSLINYDNFLWCTCTTAYVGDWCGMVLLNQAWAKRLSRLRTPPETQWGTRQVIIQPTKRRSSTPNSVTTCENIHLHSVDTCRYIWQQTLTWTITKIIPLQTCSWVPKTWWTTPWILNTFLVGEVFLSFS